ncbi:MAG: hypothetical protein HDR36_02305 [Treponema sp.]|nr:hypothetical protein [Treponema sp.]MBD5437888.1 hypothetical protein [Treponema sp.]MBD5441004.1 hypothetical protein [Treponema sp.]
MTKEQKDKAAKIWDDVKGGLEKGYAASKKGLAKAGVAIQKFSDKSVVAVEKKQLESKRKKSYARLGEIAAKKLSAKNASPISASDEDVAALLKEIAGFNKEIAKCEKQLKEFETDGKKSSEKPAAKKRAERVAEH